MLTATSGYKWIKLVAGQHVSWCKRGFKLHDAYTHLPYVVSIGGRRGSYNYVLEGLRLVCQKNTRVHPLCNSQVVIVDKICTKICDFQAISHCISETMRDRAIVTMER